jgi:hypothetical protein
MKMNKKLFVLVCLLWTNLVIVSSQGLYRQSHNHPAGSEKISSGREEISGFLFESKSTLTEKPDLPGDVGAPVSDGYLILLALTGGYIAYSKKSLLRRALDAVSSLPTEKQSGTGRRLNFKNLQMKYELIFNNNNLNKKTMKTKHFLALSLVLATAISALQAQVRIGDLSAPRSGLSLDLNRNDNTAATGLGLPRVNLVNSGSAMPLAADFSSLNGTIVYNLTVDPEAGLPQVGIYVAGTSSWVRLLMGGETTEYADIVLLNPLPATVWLGANGTESRQLTITTSIDASTTLYYQWYYLDSGETTPQPISGQTSQTFEISKGNASYQLQSEGEIKKYFCVVRNGTKSTVTARVRAIYGIGVFLNNDQWLNVLGYNLGVSEEGKSLTPAEQYNECANNNNAGGATIGGYLYQWGRAADGHQLRDTTQKSVPQFIYRDVLSAANGVAVNSGTGQIDNGSAGYGQFILRNDVTAGSVFDWRNYTATKWADADDPCRSLSLGDGKNWRLPTSGEWGLIYANNYPQNTGSGVHFRPDGSNASVFLPAAGYRNRSLGALTNVGAVGNYWSSSANSSGGVFVLGFNSSTVSPATTSYRSYGFSVRCISE